MTDAATLEPPLAKPPHVADGAVYDFDMFRDPGLLADPHARIMELVRDAPPVFWTPRNGGHWMLAGHAAVFEASRDWDSFTSQQFSPEMLAAMIAQMPKDMPRIPQTVPIGLDPPAHGIYRAPLNAVFSPKAIMAMKASIRELAAELIAEVRPRGTCEFMAAVAEPLPVQVFLKMLGLPIDRQEEYRRLVKENLAELGGPPGVAAMKIREIADVMRPTMLELRDNPGDDIISMLWQTEIDGKPTTIEDLENFGVLLFIAGLDTVMNGIGFGVRHLASDLALQDELRANPKLVPEAAEELLRRYTFTVPTRRVARDIDFHGVTMKANERAMLFLPAADLTPSEFPDPETFDLKRENKVHIAFGTGPHRCLGSHLARVELQVLYEELVAGLPRFRIDPAAPPTFHGGHVVGVDTLNLVWDV